MRRCGSWGAKGRIYPLGSRAAEEKTSVFAVQGLGSAEEGTSEEETIKGSLSQASA